MSLFELINLAFDENASGKQDPEITPARILQFLLFVRNHITPDRGYLFTSIPSSDRVVQLMDNCSLVSARPSEMPSATNPEGAPHPSSAKVDTRSNDNLAPADQCGSPPPSVITIQPQAQPSINHAEYPNKRKLYIERIQGILGGLQKHMITVQLPHREYSPVNTSEPEAQSRTFSGKECPFFSWIERLDIPKICHRVYRHPNKKKEDSIDGIIQDALALAQRIAFIDPYLTLEPDKMGRRVFNWIQSAAHARQVAIIVQYPPEPKSGKESSIDIVNRLENHLNELARKIPKERNDNLRLSAFVLKEKSPVRVRLHGRYIHTDLFTIAVEGGLDYGEREYNGVQQEADEKTDVYLLNRNVHGIIAKEYIDDFGQNFNIGPAWEKMPKATCFTQNPRATPFTPLPRT